MVCTAFTAMPCIDDHIAGLYYDEESTLKVKARWLLRLSDREVSRATRSRVAEIVPRFIESSCWWLESSMILNRPTF